jgi:transcriptional regulator with XRE-family HTH domain
MVEKHPLSPEAADIFRRLDALGLTQKALADALSIEANKISKTRSGERRFSAEELLGARKWIADHEARAIRAGLPEAPRPSAANEAGPIPLRLLDLDLSMGDGSNLDDYVEEGTIDFDANLLRTITRTPPDRLYVARGSGDSMFPTLVNGDMVVIDPLQRMLNLQDRIWAISLFGAGAIKRLRAVAKDRVEVISDNAARENQLVSGEDLRILGRIIWVGRQV